MATGQVPAPCVGEWSAVILHTQGLGLWLGPGGYPYTPGPQGWISWPVIHPHDNCLVLAGCQSTHGWILWGHWCHDFMEVRPQQQLLCPPDTDTHSSAVPALAEELGVTPLYVRQGSLPSCSWPVCINDVRTRCTFARHTCLVAAKALWSKCFRDMTPLLAQPLPESGHSLWARLQLDPDDMPLDGWGTDGGENMPLDC